LKVIKTVDSQDNCYYKAGKVADFLETGWIWYAHGRE